jgi:hypothetical protein
MYTRLLTPQLVLTVACVVLLIGAAVAVFHVDQPQLSTLKCLFFAIKAITTSGVPDNPSVMVERFLIIYLPVGVFAWACMIDALINRR